MHGPQLWDSPRWQDEEPAHSTTAETTKAPVLQLQPVEKEFSSLETQAFQKLICPHLFADRALTLSEMVRNLNTKLPSQQRSFLFFSLHLRRQGRDNRTHLCLTHTPSLELEN